MRNYNAITTNNLAFLFPLCLKLERIFFKESMLIMLIVCIILSHVLLVGVWPEDACTEIGQMVVISPYHAPHGWPCLGAFTQLFMA